MAPLDDRVGADQHERALREAAPRAAAAAAMAAATYRYPGGFPQRALVLIGPDAVVQWSHEADSPGDLPGANLIFDAL